MKNKMKKKFVRSRKWYQNQNNNDSLITQQASTFLNPFAQKQTNKRNFNKTVNKQNRNKHFNPFKQQITYSTDTADFISISSPINYNKNKNKRARKKSRNNNIYSNNNNNNKNNSNNNSSNNKVNKGIFSRKCEKLKKSALYEMKKTKAKEIKQLKEMESRQKVIVLDSESSEDDDEIVEIKLPSPPLVTIADSSDESSNEDIEHINNKNVENVTDSNFFVGDSRCTSPNDFIGNADKVRLMETNEGNELYIEENITNFEKSDSVIIENDDDNIFVSPQSKKMNIRQNTTDNYQVTQSSFRALDVYESESSDMPESVYAKGRTKGPSKASSDSDDVEEIDDDECGQKTKKLRKRRTSSNRGSEVNDDDNNETDSDDNNENEEGIASLPYISRGEAVENCKTKFNKRRRTKSTVADDNEFISILKNMAQTGQIEDDGNETDVSNKSDDEDAVKNITARHIAEDVIHRQMSNSNQNIEPMVVEENTSTNFDENLPDENSVQCREEKDLNKEEAVPEKIGNNLDRFLNIIDQLDQDHNENKINNDFQNENCMENDFNSTDDPYNDEKMYTETNAGMHVEDDGDDDNNDDLEVIDTRNIQNEEKTFNRNQILNIVYSNNNKYIGWNDEMIRFYDRSWGGERFSVKEIKNSMNAASRWTICKEDRFPKIKRYSNMKCFNCCEFGHLQMRCPLPKKVPVCYMCGENGHKEPRCPNTICLRCGNKTRVFTKFCGKCSSQNRLVCPICKINGHSIEYCPDKWRRYHSTTIPNEFPNKNVVYKKRKFCCICAGRGHLSENCRSPFRSSSEYPSISSEIKSHTKSYQDVDIAYTVAPNVIAYNLFYEPNDNINFNFSTSVNLSKRQYYWRFLNSVGLLHILSRKQRQLRPIECRNEKNDDADENEPKMKRNKTDSDDEKSENNSNETNDNNKKILTIEKNFIEKIKGSVGKKTGNPLLKKVLQKNFEKIRTLDRKGSNNKNLKEKNITITEQNQTEEENIDVESILEEEMNEEGKAQEEQEEILKSEAKTIQEQESNVEIFENNMENDGDNELVDITGENENENSIVVDDYDDDVEIYNVANVSNVSIKKESPIITEIIDCDASEEEEEMDNDDDIDDYDEEEESDETEEVAEANEENKELDSTELPPPDFLMNVLMPNQSERSENEMEENKNCEKTQTQQLEISQLPDFIPLSTIDDKFEDNSENNPIGISHRLSGRSYDGDYANFIPDKDMPGAAKIHLTNFHGKYLLTAEGQKFLYEKCKKHNIKASISWTSQGNHLVINGLPQDRVRFHTDLLLAFRNISDTPVIRIEKRTKIPRKRMAAIKFIQREIHQLTKNFGNVQSIYTRFSASKLSLSGGSNSSAIRRGRRTLNMILLGQQGLGEGRYHLVALTNLLKTLQESDYDRIPDDIHLKIYNHWKFIFSSHLHDNVHELYREYSKLKRQNLISKFNLVKVLGKNAIFVTFTRTHVTSPGLPAVLSPDVNLKQLLTTTSSSSSVSADKKKNLVFNPFSLYQGLIPGIRKKLNFDKNNLETEDNHTKETSQNQAQNENSNSCSSNETDTNISAAVDNNSNSNKINSSADQLKNHIENNSSQILKDNFEKITAPLLTENTTTAGNSPLPKETITTTATVMSPLSSSPFLMQQSSSLSPPTSSFVSNKVTEVKKSWENQCENLLNKIGCDDETKKQQKSPTNTNKSIFWSRECMKYIDLCIQMANKLNHNLKEKFHNINQKANKGELSYNDCMMTAKVYNLIKAKVT